MRVFVIVVCVGLGLLLLAAGLIGGFWWYKGADMMAAVEQGTVDGARYGAEHDDLGCQERSLTLMAECDGLVCSMYDQAFFSACLTRASKGDLCEGIPTDLGLSSSIMWVSKQCTEMAQEESECTSMMQLVLEYCARQ